MPIQVQVTSICCMCVIHHFILKHSLCIWMSYYITACKYTHTLWWGGEGQQWRWQRWWWCRHLDDYSIDMPDPHTHTLKHKREKNVLCPQESCVCRRAGCKTMSPRFQHCPEWPSWRSSPAGPADACWLSGIYCSSRAATASRREFKDTMCV